VTAGYSGTPLPTKLVIKEASVLAVINDPGYFLDLVAPLPGGVVVRRTARGKADTVVFFTAKRRQLERRIGSLRRLIEPDGGIWICWPKRSSSVPTDITGDVVREVVLSLGLVDVKVAAIDETWSGLRIVIRRENR